MQNEPDMFKKLLLQAVALFASCLVVKGVLYLFKIKVEFLWLFVPAVTLDLFGRFILKNEAFFSMVGALALMSITVSKIVSTEEFDVPFLAIFLPSLLIILLNIYFQKEKKG